MYSGSESGDSQKCAAQWPLNPAAYQNMASDQVDWAALAQQWIIMKEAGPPPVPLEHLADMNKIKHGDIVGGEAPMEVENANDDAPSWGSGGDAPPAPGAEAWNNWNSSSAWGWPVAPPPPPLTHGKPPPLLPTPTYPSAADDNAVPFSGYTTGPNKNKGSYWNSPSVVQKEIKPHNKRYSKVNVPIKAPVHIPPPLLQTPVAPPPEMMSETPTLDAAKRKQLPAWIREGLEKMEKDKLKQMQKEKEKQVIEEYKERAKLDEQERLEVLKTTMKEQQLQKSKFDSDEESDKEQSRKKQTRSPEPPVQLTPEERMMQVRRNMTEILLKSTSKFIEQICKEEHQRYMKKRRASTQLASAPSGAILSAKLGLGAYNDDSSDNSDSEPEEKDRYQSDSDSELKESIKRKMADFSKVEREIEDRLANAENKDESRSRSSSPDVRGNDSQVDQPSQEHKLKSDKNGSALDSRNKSQSGSSSESSDYKNSRNPSRRKSTSSTERQESKDYSEKHSRRQSDSVKSETERRKSSRHRDRSESETPDRKYKRQSSRYSKTPDRKRRSRSRSSHRDSTESKKRSRRSDESRHSHKSRRSRSRSRSSSYHKGSSKKSSRRTRSRSRSSRRSSNRSKRRSRSYSGSRRRRSSSRSRRRRSKSSSSSEDRSSRGKRSHRR